MKIYQGDFHISGCVFQCYFVTRNSLCLRTATQNQGEPETKKDVAASEELKSYRQRLEAKESECQELEDAVQYYERQIGYFQAEGKALNSQVQQLCSENKSKSEECERLSARAVTLEKQLSLLQTDCSELGANVKK
jgi:chromosome segregation ATPase